jgi:hypothetical protein
MAEDRTPVAPSRGTLTASQRRNREHAERVIGLMAPFLDLLLAVGDRISRIAEPEDHEYYPVRAEELPGDDRKGAVSGD